MGEKNETNCRSNLIQIEGRYKPTLPLITLFLKIFLNVYLFLRQRQSMSWGGIERERVFERQNLRQAPGSKLSAQSPTCGSNL